MQKIYVFFCLVTAVLVFSGCQSNTEPAPQPAKRGSALPVEDPSLVLDNSVIPLAERIANDSGVPEAITVANWYTENATPAIVSATQGGGFELAVEPRYKNRRLPVVLVGQNEAAVSEDLRQWLENSKAEGEFRMMRNRPLVLLRERERNVLDFGILQLHEAYHAKRIIEDNARKEYSSDESMDAYEHADIYTLEHEIRTKIGGADYMTLVQEEKQRLMKLGARMGVNPDGESMNLHVAPPISRRAELEALFGPCGCEQDAIKRDTALWRQAVYELMEKSFPVDKVRMAKATLYSQMRHQTGQRH